MNQPTREEFERLEEEQRQLKEEVRQLREQITEPIRIDRLEIDRGGTQEMLKETNKKLKQIIQTQTDRSEKLEALERGQQEQKQALLQEIHTISNTWLDSLQENVDEINQEIAGARADILALRESQSDLRDTLQNMATKQDITSIREGMAAMATRQDLAVMSDRIMEMFQKLLQKPGEG